jgi:ATP-dependent DNA helicase RecG
VLDDLDPARFESYCREVEARRPGSVPAQEPVEVLLTQVGAVAQVRRRLQPTLAGILFFGRDPQRFYPSLTITFMHFAGTLAGGTEPDAPLYLDSREFRGTIPQMVEQTRAAIYESLSKQGVVEGFRRRDRPELPESAYREAILNAVAHRDYDLLGSFVQVRLFADRLEVQSPGGLGGNLTVDNIVYEQFTRNPHIVRLLEDLGYVEHRGLGIDRMLRTMSDHGLDPPQFQDRGSSFWVTLRRRPAAPPLPDLQGLGLNQRQEAAVAYMQQHGRITNREYQTEFDVSERTALYDLQGLVSAGLALPVSSGRGRYYILRG